MKAPDRVPLCTALTRAQLGAVAVVAAGHRIEEAARILGIERPTLDWHLAAAARRIPGDLSRVARCVAWYRGASLVVLGAAGPKSRQETFHEAHTIAGGRGCPRCGYAGVTSVTEVDDGRRAAREDSGPT